MSRYVLAMERPDQLEVELRAAGGRWLRGLRSRSRRFQPCRLRFAGSHVALFRQYRSRLDRAKAWARLCDTSHTGKCHALSERDGIPPPASAPLLLVDVHSRSLVDVSLRGLPTTQYTALSYVCGRLPDVLTTTKESLVHLRIQGALASQPWSVTPPDVVRDAIELTNRLGIPSLWVDRLCIVQDEPPQKSLQLAQMGAIYANAYMTIIAADGNYAQCGLRGSCPEIARAPVVPSPYARFRKGRGGGRL